MIQAVNEYVQSLHTEKPLTLFDIGTGCGVLGLSTLLHNPNRFQRAYLSEYIDYTLSLATENFEYYKDKL
jgi:methylase of polypeptide subunit release factors